MRESPFGWLSLIAAPFPRAAFFSWRKRRARLARAVKPHGLFPARVGLDPGDEEETDILTLDATPLIYALVNAVKELAARVAVLEGR
jgi:hypothetical protein